MPSIGLCMIVKDEARVIRRCLESAAPWIDYAVIVDTGSSDGTMVAINQACRDFGITNWNIECMEWSDFSTNRNQALDLLRKSGHVDYALFIDADEVIAAPIEAEKIARVKETLSADWYNALIQLGPITYLRPTLVKLDKPFKYIGVCHECLICAEPFSQVVEPVLTVKSLHDGARSRDSEKYRKDAKALEQAMRIEPDKNLQARYCFYLAQSWRDADALEDAKKWYTTRLEMGGFTAEIFLSHLNLGHIYTDQPRSMYHYLQAHETDPNRVEPMYYAARLARQHQCYHQACLFAWRGTELKGSGMFDEAWIRNWGIYEEHGLALYYMGLHPQAHSAFLAAYQNAPKTERERLQQNILWALSKIEPPE